MHAAKNITYQECEKYSFYVYVSIQNIKVLAIISLFNWINCTVINKIANQGSSYNLSIFHMILTVRLTCCTRQRPANSNIVFIPLECDANLTFIAQYLEKENTDHMMSTSFHITPICSKKVQQIYQFTLLEGLMCSEKLVHSKTDTVKSHPLPKWSTPLLTSYWAQSGSKFGTVVNCLWKGISLGEVGAVWNPRP